MGLPPALSLARPAASDSTSLYATAEYSGRTRRPPCEGPPFSIPFSSRPVNHSVVLRSPAAACGARVTEECRSWDPSVCTCVFPLFSSSSSARAAHTPPTYDCYYFYTMFRPPRPYSKNTQQKTLSGWSTFTHLGRWSSCLQPPSPLVPNHKYTHDVHAPGRDPVLAPPPVPTNSCDAPVVGSFYVSVGFAFWGVAVECGQTTGKRPPCIHAHG